MHRLPNHDSRFLLAAILVATVLGCEKPENTYVPPPPPEVTVAKPVLQAIPEFLEREGETEAAEEAEVRARVKGFIQDIQFDPADPVEVGDVLYLIEPDTYQAALDSAKAADKAAEAAILVANATLKNAEAEKVRTKADLDREKRLLDGNAGSQSDYDRALANDEAAKARIESATANIEVAKAEKLAAEAAVQQAQLDLDYTKVTAPIAGYITKTQVKKGNLVESGTALATIINRDRIFANFSLSDRQMLRLQKEYFDGVKAGTQVDEPDWSDITVLMRRELDEGFPFTGRLDYIDQVGVDARTATLGLRAVFENTDDQLVSGLFVTVRVPSRQTNEALLIPESALARDQLGSFVLTVGADNKVKEARVTVTARISGWAAVEGQIDQSTQVIIDGLQRAIPGSEVKGVEQPLQVDEESLLRGAMAPAVKQGTRVASS